MSVEEVKGAVSYERLLQILKECEHYRCANVKCNGLNCRKCVTSTLKLTDEEYEALFN